jgi:hypothetical protein
MRSLQASQSPRRISFESSGRRGEGPVLPDGASADRCAGGLVEPEPRGFTRSRRRSPRWQSTRGSGRRTRTIRDTGPGDSRALLTSSSPGSMTRWRRSGSSAHGAGGRQFESGFPLRNNGR